MSVSVAVTVANTLLVLVHVNIEVALAIRSILRLISILSDVDIAIYVLP